VSRFGSAESLAMRIAMLGITALAAAVVPAGAQETVSVSVPVAVSFSVADVSRSTSGAPNPTTISFSNAILVPGKAFRVSVQADAAAFTPPSGASIPAAKLSWTIFGAAGGTGSNGTLSSSSYSLVYQSNAAGLFPLAGHVDLAWTLAAPGAGLRAGTHALTIRWKLESITP
jgi:hypothetical protein